MVDGCGWCMMVPYAIAVSRKKCCFPLEKMLVPRLFQPFNPLFMVNQRGHFPWDKICWFPGSLAMFLKCLSLALVRQMTRL